MCLASPPDDNINANKSESSYHHHKVVEWFLVESNQYQCDDTDDNDNDTYTIGHDDDNISIQKNT